jgi:hypothetical protein
MTTEMPGFLLFPDPLNVPLDRRSPDEVVPLTYTQQARWTAFSVIGMDRNTRTCAVARRLSGRLDVGCLRKSFNELVRRHEALRTRIVVTPDGPVQQIDASAQYELPVFTLADRPATAKAEARDLVEEFVNEPVDMTRGPLFGARLIKLSDSDHVLVMAADHMIADGMSMLLLLSDVWVTYAQELEGLPSSLPETRVQFGDYAVWQFKTSSLWLKKHSTYWGQRFVGASRLELPSDTTEEPGVSSRGAWSRQEIWFDSDLRTRLSHIAHRQGSTLAMCVLAAYGAVLLRSSNKRALAIGLMTAGRPRTELHHTVGFFASTLYLRLESSADDDFAEFLRRVTGEYRAALEHHDFGLLPLVMSKCPFNQYATFHWNADTRRSTCARPPGAHAHGAQTALDASLRAEPFMFNRTELEMQWEGDLSIHPGQPWAWFLDLGDGLAGCLQYRTSRFSCNSMARFTRNLRRFVELVLNNPTSRVYSIPQE